MADRDRDLLRDLLEHGEEAVGYLRGVSRAQFRADRRLQLVTERLLEIVGEAGAKLSAEAQAAVPYDWRAVRGLRNILAHQYGSVDHDALYATATRELPALLGKVREAVRRRSRAPSPRTRASRASASRARPPSSSA